MCNVELAAPDGSFVLRPTNQVRLSRFDSKVWVVEYGWYSWGNNRPVCGWYLRDKSDPKLIKPLQLSDLDDIYFVQS